MMDLIRDSQLRPDSPLPPELIVVGIDLGLTFSGVAFSTPEMSQPLVIQTWPGPDPTLIAKKVPTVLNYRAGRASVRWGFELAPQGRGWNVKELFKLWLHPAALNKKFCQNQDPCTIDDVRMWYRDFLTALRKHIAGYLEDLFGRDWEKSRIEFIFSVPTTWKQLAVVEDFRAIMKEAGFCLNKNSVTIGLTEAEAAAVYTVSGDTMRHGIREGHTLLICDAGGGTTVRKAIGSVHIDEAFEAVARERLELIRRDAPNLPANAAYTMAKGHLHFQVVKSKFGTGLDVEELRIGVPGLPRDFTDPHAGIKKGFMIFKYSEIQEMFDRQIHRIYDVIDKQLSRLERFQPDERVGLVIDRLHRLRHHVSILRYRRCRTSYGVVFNELYSREKHSRQRAVRDPIDGKKYAEDQICWLVRKGQEIDSDTPIKHRFTRIADASNPDKNWKHEIVESQSNGSPPQSINDGDAQIVGEVVSDLTSHRLAPGSAGVTAENRRRWPFFSPRKSYLKIDHEVSVSVGPADLKFEILIDGESVNKKGVPARWMYTWDDERGRGARDSEDFEEGKNAEWNDGIVQRA
ncbi:hypothetical protein FGG08_000478 [Glutinoglossum americanum]|uniref:Uncharacterized protein n=1 Tax=Glutinoglossum americanum TaxID=1670608 RepID=A0A9P8IA86_9PEZI|nr:hypothetical protein FGG08_000478 [Glutinoglossum americanum]